MTNETRQRIEHYTKLLPGMKEKIMAATMMFVMALAVMVTATYAWITLSSAPQVTSIDTSVVANGSLEIALANGTGTAPGKSAEGDSTGAGNPVNAANITWGNLVNLSDSSYGLSKITLRPAALNGKSGLLTNPLYGVGYGEDGRISTMVTDDDFAYAYYDSESGKFIADLDGSHLGVRAISTVRYQNLEGDQTLIDLLGDINGNLTLAKTFYAQMTNNNQEPGNAYIKSLQGLIETYAQNVIDRKPEAELEVTDYVVDLYKMMDYLYKMVMVSTGDSYVSMANMLDLLKGSGVGDSGYDLTSLMEAVNEKTLPDYMYDKSGNAYMKSLQSFADDYEKLNTYLATSTKEDFSDFTDSQKKSSLAYWAYYAGEGGHVYWSDIKNFINWVVDIQTAKLDGHTLSELRNMSTASTILRGKNPHSATIEKGALYRVEQRLGEKMSPEIAVTVDASSIVSFIGKVDMTAILTTTAIDPYDIITDRENIVGLYDGNIKGDTATAEDTYAMAIDLWLRTNSGTKVTDSTTSTSVETDENGVETTKTIVTSPEKAFLTLEGAVRTEIKNVPATIKDANGDEQPAYTASYTLDGEEISITVFQRYGNYYYIDEETGVETEIETVLKEEYGIVPEITPKISSQEVVVGYDGENRVWSDDQMIEYASTGTSTTQGSGSCYMFYADNPADQSRFLELLKSMKVIFVNGVGRQIGSATMDTKNHYAENGKVTVPLVLDKSEAVNLGIDVKGNTIYGLTELDKNVATRITALVYLDGSTLTNEMVLAKGDIQGSLNIQFGCTPAVKTTTTITTGEETTTTVEYIQGTEAEAIKQPEVMDDYVTASAEANPVSFNHDPQNPAKSTLNLTINGVEPNSVTARFIRAISSTQGVQQEMFSLNGSGSNWSAECKFDKPGNYILRTVWIDGVEYNLEKSVSITVTGSSVNSLICDAIPAGSNKATIMTADASFSTEITLGFSTSAQAPKSVKGIFMDENGRQVNVPFEDESGTWVGKAIFTTSGEFTMNYVEIDGEIYELSESLQPTLEVLLGLKASVRISASDETLAKLKEINPNAVATSFVLDTSVLDVVNKRDVTLDISVEIYDNNGNEITGLSDAKLYYGRLGTSILARGLNTDLAWDINKGVYTGAFLVTEAGTYNFSQVVVNSAGNTNTITSYTTASSIQAMPPEDAYYFNAYTNEYQYAPNLDASMTVGIAYSNAAAKVEATITNGTTTQVVEGVMGAETEDQGEDTVNLWSFKVPTVNNSQEGKWKLTDITMYGVYYEGVYYDPDGNGIRIDLSNKNIETKVVNYLYVTLSGTSQQFSGYFMDDHEVTDMVVTIEDYEGEAVQGINISDVKVVYHLDSSKVNLDTYGYTAEGLATKTVDGTYTGDPVNGVEYPIPSMNFMCAGPYNTCEVSFTIDGVITTATSNKCSLRYMEAGELKDTCPTYDVKWTAPKVTITGTSPAGRTADNPSGGNSFDFNIGESSLTGYNVVSVKNYYEAYYANVYFEANILFGVLTGYSVPKVTFKLDNAGSKVSSNNQATITVPNNGGAQYARSASFKSNASAALCEVGAMDSLTRKYAGNVKISTITMNYGGNAYELKLENQINIKNDGTLPGKISYSIPEEYSGLFVAPDSFTDYSARNKVKLPSLSNATGYIDEDTGITEVEGSRTEPQYTNVYTYSSQEVTTGSGCNKKTTYTITYNFYRRATTTWTESSVVNTYKYDYIFKGWTISNKLQTAGTEVNITSDTTAESSITKVRADSPEETKVKTRTTTNVTDTFVETRVVEGQSSSNPANPFEGYSKVDAVYEGNGNTTNTEWK